MTTEEKLLALENENRLLKLELEKLTKEKQQDAAYKQQNLLEQILNEIPVGIALHEGPEFITTLVNKSYYDFAYGKGDVRGRKVADVWPEVADQIIPLLTRVYETGEPYHADDAEFIIDRGKGPERAWFSFSYLPYRGEAEKITGILVWSFESTSYVLSRIKLEQSHEELYRNTAQLEATIDSLPDGYILYNSQGEIMRMNEIAQKLFKYSADEKKLPYNQRVKRLNAQTPDGEPLPLEQVFYKVLKGNKIRNLVFRITRSGQERWIATSASPVLLPSGNNLGVVMQFTDISELKNAEIALREANAMRDAIIDAMPTGILIADEKGKVIRHNEAAVNLWGIPPETHSWEEYKDWVGWWPETGERIKAEEWGMARALVHGEEVFNELVQNQPFNSEERRYFLNNAVPLKNGKGEITGGVVAMQDVTDRIAAEQALRQSEEKFRAVFEQAGVGIGRVGFRDARWIDVNAAFCEMLGYTADEFKATPWMQITHPEDIDLDLIPFKKMAAGEIDSYSVEKRFVHKKGHFVWARLTLSLVRTEQGRPDYEIAIIENISERKNAEEALRESEEHFRTMADNISQLAWMADENGWIFWYNKRWFDYTGTNLEEMQGWGWKKVHHPDYIERVVEKIQHSWDTGKRWEDIFPLHGKNGKYRWFLSRAVPVRDEKGNIIRWFGTNTDVTEQRKSEQLLKRQARMLDQVQDAIVGLDNNGLITYMNEAAYKMYEIAKDPAVLGSKLGDFYTVHWDHIHSEKEMYNKLDEKGTWTGENIHVTAKGKKLWVDSVVSAVKDEKGKITGIISAMRDVSNRKEMERTLNRQLDELQKDNELFENILYIIAHDLKGPIANMYLALNLINSADETGEKIKMLNMFRPLVERMENTIQGVTGILQVQKTDQSAAVKVYFESILNDILLELKGNLKSGTLEPVFKRKTIRYIEPFLVSVMKNLVNNAIKYSRENVKLHIEITTETKNGYILLMVKDNGIGIDLERHGDQLFSPFKRFSSKKAEGTGVGLYIIRNIVEKNGGYIEVNSKPGVGTAFYCYLKEY